MELSIVQDTAHLLKKEFDNLPDKFYKKHDLVEALRPLIQEMLNRDFERFLQLCYRIDLGEEKLKRILHESEPERVGLDLAAAIVDRQMLKIQLRRKYST
ncbi:hypothetical protein KIH41_16045 [Litoribacter ruber]|uniref:hypothetical protein n=1 Tax=Litoribacter ruber TaxID=702568 RepID=UPI001BDAA5EA|nr:hypothetical protein [Litoribacter ruber]MBT0812799.1 hypothetical protein [Litoribacter ruber]